MIHGAAIETSAENIHGVDHFIAAALRDASKLPSLLNPNLVPERALYHGVSALLASLTKVMAALPPQIQASLRQQAIAEAMWDLRHRQILMPLLEDFANADIPVILLKGTAFAYSCYPSSSLRPRGDTDILVPAMKQDAIFQILQSHGFSRELNSATGAPAAIVRQESWSYYAADGSKHFLDLHWEVMHSFSLAHLFDSDTVREKSQTLEQLTSSARIMCNLDAVYHACIHRAVHIQSPYYIKEQEFRGGDRLVWLYDIHLMLPKLTTADWSDLLCLCKSHDTADICRNALTDANRLLGSQVPLNVLADLGAKHQEGNPMHFLANTSGRRAIASNLRAIPTMREKQKYLRHILFPSKAYMNAKYPKMTGTPTVLLHLYRITSALFRKNPDNHQ